MAMWTRATARPRTPSQFTEQGWPLSMWRLRRGLRMVRMAPSKMRIIRALIDTYLMLVTNKY
jgi:hypothetical protein